MKTYLSTGIGDMVALDCILPDDEKQSISEIYWACRFGSCIIPLLDQNPAYPNLVKHHTIPDEVGKRAMQDFEPWSTSFWHFRPDFHPNFERGLELLNITDVSRIHVIDVIRRFQDVMQLIRSDVDQSKYYFGSSILRNAQPPNIGKYILFHYPTSSRPRGDIAGIDDRDWQFVDSLSQQTNLQVVVVADCDIQPPLSNYTLLINPSIKYVADLVAHCEYYTGCDSFCSILAAKRLPKEKMFVKTHDQNIKSSFHSPTANFFCYYLPHSPTDIAEFYKPYLGY